MTPQRWEQIEALFHEAVKLAPAAQAAWLERACDGDTELRREVEALLAADANDSQTTAMLSPDVLAAGLAEATPLIGKRIHRYEILSRIGAGGMGEVWLAEDTHLHRKVALKLLPAQFASDADRLRRFEQEARAVSALNHPNIITLFDLGQAGEQYFMATEFIDGQTLRERLRSQPPLSTTEALEITLQICHALAAAHEAGIIHRDIKPENIMLRRDGYVKVLDFGLAKLSARDEGGGMKDESEQETSIHPSSLRPHPSTTPGLVMGTASYMSPEQARGERVDARTDVFSLGIVLYEMLEGRAPFPGASTFDVIAAILDREPVPLRQAPTALQQIVYQSLRKDRTERYQRISDLRDALKACQRSISEAPRSIATAETLTLPTTAIVAQTTASSGSIILGEIKRHKVGVLATLAALGLVLVGGGYTAYRTLLRPTASAPALATTAKITPLTSFPGLEAKQSFSPDGKQIAFMWSGEQDENQEIYLKQTDGEGLLRLTNNPAVDSDPVWSPDGRSIAFTRYTEDGGGVYVMPAVGGVARKLTTFSPLRPRLIAGPELSWSPDGKLLAFGDRPTPQSPLELTLLHLDTGARQSLTQAVRGGVGDFLPTFSPDGQTVAFLRVENVDSFREIFLVPITGGEPRRLTSNRRSISSLAWLGNGNELLYSATEDLAISIWQFDVATGAERRITGPEALVAGVAVDRQSDRLSYIKVNYDLDVLRIGLKGLESDHQSPSKLLGSTTPESFQRYSPDGQKLTYTSYRSGRGETWLCDSQGQNAVQLTNDPKSAPGSPNWSPDGRQITYNAWINGKADIYTQTVEGGQRTRLTNDGFMNVVPSWSHDGKWIYYSSDRTGSPQIWKLPAMGGEPIQLTKQGGIDPLESWDGKFVVYVKNRQTPGLWRVDLATGEESLITDIHQAGYWRSWDVTKGGIFFATCESPLRSMIEFYDFATGKISLVTKLKRTFPVGSGNISVSPDGRWLTFLEEQLGGDLMLVENWR